MSEKIDDHKLSAFEDPDIAKKVYKIAASLEELMYYTRATYGASAASDVLTSISLDVISAVVILMTDPEKYKLVCKDIGEMLHKKVVAEKKSRDAREKP